MVIQFNPKDRLSFEEIYRNKWLNKDWNQILEIVNANQSDEEKMIEELNKSDYLFEKNKYIKYSKPLNYFLYVIIFPPYKLKVFAL